jgi:hypothetical protein
MAFSSVALVWDCARLHVNEPICRFGAMRAVQAYMKPLTIVGIILIIFGVFALAAQRISYTKSEKVIDLGPVEATAERRKTIPIPPVAGGATLAAGVLLVIAGSRSGAS